MLLTLHHIANCDIVRGMKIYRRGDHLYIRKRVPRRFQPVEDREYLWLSLHTVSETVAKTKAPKVWADMIEAWEAKLEGADAEAEGRMAAARELAAKRGFRFMAAKEVARLPIDELLERVEAVVTPKGKVDQVEAAAILDGAKPAGLTVTSALARYWKVAKAKTLGKSPDQVRRWENPRKKAVANFVEALGTDMRIEDITTKDLHSFKAWWVEKIAANSLSPDSANKDFVHLTSMLTSTLHAVVLGDLRRKVNSVLGFVVTDADAMSVIAQGEMTFSQGFEDVPLEETVGGSAPVTSSERVKPRAPRSDREAALIEPRLMAHVNQFSTTLREGTEDPFSLRRAMVLRLLIMAILAEPHHHGWPITRHNCSPPTRG